MSQTEDKVLWSGRFLRIVQRGHWEFAQRCNASGVVGIVAVTTDGRLLLVEQYRIPLRARVLELPAGLAGDVAGQETEAFELAARRELLEETGYSGGSWKPLFGGPSSAGLTDEALMLFLAEGVQKTAEGGGDESEEIRVEAVPLDEVPAFFASAEGRRVHVDLKARLAWYYLQACI